MSAQLREAAAAVASRSELAAFVGALAREAQVSGGGWENSSLESYLEALGAWVDDLEGFRLNRGEAVESTPSWRLIAEMLLAATVYE